MSQYITRTQFDWLILVIIRSAGARFIGRLVNDVIRSRGRVLSVSLLSFYDAEGMFKQRGGEW